VRPPSRSRGGINIERRSPTKQDQEAPPQILAALLGAGGDNSEIIALPTITGGLMNFGTYPPDQIRAFTTLDSKVQRINEKTERLLEQLIAVCVEYRALSDAGVVIERSEDLGGIAVIKSPVGVARVTQGWAIENAELNGKILFERQLLDQYDRIYWEAIWGLSVPEYEYPFTGSGETTLRIPFDDDFGDHRRKALHTALLSIMYGIVNGPVK
jgi:hypothetical protein